MKYNPKNPPREFRCGKDDAITIRDCAHIELAPKEQITLTTPSGTEFDVLRMEWGYLATPSMNVRLPKFGLKSALVRSSIGRYFLLLVEETKRQDFLAYIAFENLEVVAWLDDNAVLERIRQLPH